MDNAPWLNDPVVSSTGAHDAPWLNDPVVKTSGPDTEANKGIAEKAFDALRYGVQQDVSGISKTVGGPEAPIGNAPYTPASEGLHDTSKSYLTRATYLPRVLLESLPQGAQHALAGAGAGALGGALGGPLGATIGGAAGAIGSYGLSNYGTEVADTAASAGEDPNNPSTTSKARALGSTVLGGLLSRLGFVKGLGTAGKAVGSEVIPAVTGAIGKSAAENALASAAQTEQHGLLVNGQQPSLDTLGTDALTGATVGAGLRSIKAPGELTQAYKFKDFGPEFNSVADRFDGKDTSTPGKSFAAVKSVENDLKNEIKTQSDTSAHISALEKQPGYDQDIKQTLDSVRGKLKAGEVVDPNAISEIKDTLGDFRQGANLSDSLETYNNLNRMKQIGQFNPRTKTFGGGIAENAIIKPILTPHLGVMPVGGAAIAGHIALGMAGMPAAGLGIMSLPAIQYGLRAATRGVDKLLGNRNPLDEFRSRFGEDASTSRFGGDTASASANLPNFRDKLAKTRGNTTAAPQEAQAPAGTAPPAEIRSAPESTHGTAQGPAEGGGPTFSVTNGDQTVTRSPEGVVKLPHYQAKMGSAMAERNNAVLDAHRALTKANAPISDHEVVEGLKSELNHGSGMGSKTAADKAIEGAIHRISPEHQDLARAALRKHHLLVFHRDK